MRPVASDLDAFLIGSKGMTFNGPLPPEQLTLVEWQLNNVESVLSKPGPQGWTKRWLEVLKQRSLELPPVPWDPPPLHLRPI